MILAGWGRDRIDGGGGVDRLVFDRGGGAHVDLTRGFSEGAGRKRVTSIEQVDGTPWADTFVGSRRSETFNGRAGDDTVAAGRGADIVDGGAGEDDLSGGRGVDRLIGGPGVDTCTRSETSVSCERRFRPVTFAVTEGLRLYMPARKLIGIGYHQSLFDTAAAMLVRIGQVMSSRGRGTPATSAADIVMRPGQKVRSPVSGRVIGVTPYRLYCGSESDVRILIEPRDDPQMRVMVLHVQDVRVKKGQRVSYAHTVLGTPRSFSSFTDQADRYFPGGYPHVHVETESPAASPLPGC